MDCPRSSSSGQPEGASISVTPFGQRCRISARRHPIGAKPRSVPTAIPVSAPSARSIPVTSFASCRRAARTVNLLVISSRATAARRTRLTRSRATPACTWGEAPSYQILLDRGRDGEAGLRDQHCGDGRPGRRMASVGGSSRSTKHELNVTDREDRWEEYGGQRSVLRENSPSRSRVRRAASKPVVAISWSSTCLRSSGVSNLTPPVETSSLPAGSATSTRTAPSPLDLPTRLCGTWVSLTLGKYGNERVEAQPRSDRPSGVTAGGSVDGFGEDLGRENPKAVRQFTRRRGAGKLKVRYGCFCG